MAAASLPLFDNQHPHFDGESYDAKLDHARLTTQLLAVREQLEYGDPLTLAELKTELAAKGIDASDASISARIRDLRKDKFGGHTILRMRVEGGVYAYQMVEDGGLE